MHFTPDSKTNLMKDEIKFLKWTGYGWMRAVRATRN